MAVDTHWFILLEEDPKSVWRHVRPLSPSPPLPSAVLSTCNLTQVWVGLGGRVSILKSQAEQVLKVKWEGIVLLPSSWILPVLIFVSRRI